MLLRVNGLRELLFIIAAPLTSLIGLAALASWWSAVIFVGGIVLFASYAVKRNSKHQYSGAYDDRISTERMEKAREWLFED